MVDKIEINPELARLAQSEARICTIPLTQKLCHLVVETAIVELEPELNLLLQPNESLSNINRLAQMVGVNDIVLNGHHIDIRHLDSEGRVSISTALLGTSYLACGSLVVSLDGAKSGAIVGYIEPSVWLNAQSIPSKEDAVSVVVGTQANYNYAKTLLEICSTSPEIKPISSLPDEAELTLFLSDRNQCTIARQRQIISAIVCDPVLKNLVERISLSVTPDFNLSLLTDSAIWANRIEKMVDKLLPKFSALTRDEIRQQIRRVGEQFGGQPETPLFRRAIVENLMREQLTHSLSGQSLVKAASVAEEVLTGRSTIETVRDFIKNQVAVDLALVIRQRRQSIEGFIKATAEEIGMAFQQLALKPVYATHGQEQKSGVESINEALELLEAANLAEQARSLEVELAIR